MGRRYFVDLNFDTGHTIVRSDTHDPKGEWEGPYPTLKEAKNHIMRSTHYNMREIADFWADIREIRVADIEVLGASIEEER